MNKRTLTLTTVLILFVLVPLAAMVTNTNQSTEYIQMLNRNASTDLDAVLYNPAGSALLDDGTYLYFSSQTIWQSRTVNTAFPKYNDSTFTGDTFVPIFPNLYFAWKKDRLALFGGFMPIGGGGSAEFPNGLPSFDYQLARLVGLPASAINSALAPYGTITGYSVDAAFTGSSVYYSGQVGGAYALNNWLSAAVALRFVYALNTYEGALNNAILEAENGDIVGVIPDMAVDSKRTGSASTVVLGLDLAPTDELNIGLRYEFITKLQVESETEEDGTKGVISEEGMFPDGVTYAEDIPAQFGAGIAYQITDKLNAQASFNYWFNTACDWDGDEELVDNDLNVGLGIEYDLSEVLTVNTGFLYSTTGASEEYNSDMDYSLGSHTLGVGLKYRLNPKLILSLGTCNTFYHPAYNDDKGTIYEEEYEKTAFVITFGIQYKLK